MIDNDIFSDNIDFGKRALEIFRYQAQNNPVYKAYLELLKIKPEIISSINQVPFLPIQFFKTHEVVSSSRFPVSSSGTTFTSSGTTGSETSKHFVTDIKLYEQSFNNCFELFYGDIKEYCFLALLPSYLEREGSSLVYMADSFIRKSNHSLSGFYLDEFEKLKHTIETLINQKQKFILLGVTYALLDFSEFCKKSVSGFDKYGMIMETGGMKGKRKEMLREEVHTILKSAFDIEHVHSEYGMTELLSQAYSKGEGKFFTSPWMKIFIRDINDPFSMIGNGQTGGISIIDLANINSCSFIATQDLGRINKDGSFEVLGRFDSSDLRGCNLMVE